MATLKNKAIINTKKLRTAVKDVGKQEPSYKVVQLLRKTGWQFLKKLNTEFPYDSTILLWDIHPQELKPGAQKKHMTILAIMVSLTVMRRLKIAETSSLKEGIWNLYNTMQRKGHTCVFRSVFLNTSFLLLALLFKNLHYKCHLIKTSTLLQNK